MLKNYISEHLWWGKQVGLQTVSYFVATSYSNIFLQWHSWDQTYSYQHGYSMSQHKEKCPQSCPAHKLLLRSCFPPSVDHGVEIPEGPLIPSVPGHHSPTILSHFTCWPEKQTTFDTIVTLKLKDVQGPSQCLLLCSVKTQGKAKQIVLFQPD